MKILRRMTLFVILAASIFAGFPAISDVGASVAPKTAPAWSGECHAAVDTYWPAAWQSWAHYVVNRESRGIPSAANRRSSARGCFQMLLRYSAPFYRAVGCNNYMWNNATCNVRAALVMRQRHGTRPWAVTRYTR